MLRTCGAPAGKRRRRLKLSYQQKRLLRILLRVLLALLLFAVLFCVCRVIYLQRFLVYDESGVHLDYTGAPKATGRQETAAETEDYAFVQQPMELPGKSEAPSSGMHGTEITAAQLLQKKNHETIRKLAKTADRLLLCVKSSRGAFLYRTGLSGVACTGDDPDAVSALFTALRETGCPLTALLPAFSDSAYALYDYTHSLLTESISLCIDENGSYLLDPAAPDTEAYLLAQARELAELGFSEICFAGFDFPETSGLVYEGDGAQAVRTLAENLSRTLRQEKIAVSFLSNDDAVTALSSHVYVTAGDGSEIAAAVEDCRALFPDDNTKLIFRTKSHDTRFQKYGTVTPLLTD